MESEMIYCGGTWTKHSKCVLHTELAFPRPERKKKIRPSNFYCCHLIFFSLPPYFPRFFLWKTTKDRRVFTSVLSFGLLLAIRNFGIKLYTAAAAFTIVLDKLADADLGIVHRIRIYFAMSMVAWRSIVARQRACNIRAFHT